MDTTQEGVSVAEGAELLLAAERKEVEAVEEKVEETEEVTEEATSEEVETEEPEGESEQDSQDADDTSEMPLELAKFAEATGLEVDDLYNLEIPIKVDGEETTANLRDVVKGYQLEKYANQKSIKLAEERKAFEAERAEKMAAVESRVEQFDQSLQLVGAQLTAKWQNVDWDALRSSDPQEFLLKQSEYNSDVAFIQQQAQQLQEGRELLNQQQKDQLSATLEEEQKRALEVIPQWSDESVRTKDVQEINDYLTGYGFSTEEIGGVTDHRMLRILMDAKKGREVTEKAPKIVKKVQKAPKKIQPGKSQPSMDKKLAALRKRARAGDFNAAVELQTLAEAANKG